VIRPNESVEQLVIAGMGGSLMTNILNDHPERLATVMRLILQPNVGTRHVRKWLLNNNYGIVAEQLIEENGHIYEIIVADYDAEQVYSNQAELKNKQILFGPLLWQEKSSIFKKKWQKELTHLQNIVKQMKQAKQHSPLLTVYVKKIRWIEEVLNNESTHSS